MERSGAMIASSSSEPPFRGSGAGRERLSATESGIPVIRDTARAIAGEFPDLAGIDGGFRRTYQIGGEGHFVHVRPLHDGRGLDWLLAVVIPESDFMAPIDASTRFSMLFSLATLVVAIAVGVYVARRIATPIHRVTHASKAIANGELEEANRELEDRVQQRTDRLAEQMEREHELEEELSNANRKLKELATVDGLTQVANRVRFDAHLQHTATA